MEEEKHIRRSKARPVLFQEWRRSMGMNRKEFCEAYEIPYDVVKQWEHEQTCVPDYLFRLWTYAVKARCVHPTHPTDQTNNLRKKG